MMESNGYLQRRRELANRVNAPVFLMGNGNRARNLPMSSVPFRQDSTFLYFSGVTRPNAAMLIQIDGTTTLFLPTPSKDDPLWHGPSPTFMELKETYGMDHVASIDTLTDLTVSPTVVTLAVPDEGKNQFLREKFGKDLVFGQSHGDDELVDAVIEMRRTKTPSEVEEMEKAAAASAKAHIAVMEATREGVREQDLAALFRGVLAVNDCVLGYPTILTVQGQILHQFHHTNVLNNGDLLLIDGGGEVSTGYGVDITRTYPVSGRFTGRQKAVYEVVLEAQLKAIEKCRPGVVFREVHDTASLVIAQFLKDEGLTNLAPESAVEIGLHALVFPHGIGHHLGLDVHDMENFGDRPSYPKGMKRPDQFGTRFLRLNLPLESGWIVTVEPGFYVVDAILDNPVLNKKFGTMFDLNKLNDWRGFGGIRIEDDILITTDAPHVISEAVPKTVSQLEAIVGTGKSVQERLG